MNTVKFSALGALLITAMLWAGSCSVKNTLDIEKNGGATLSAGIQISGVALDYLNDLSEVQGNPVEGASIFVPDQIAAYFEELPGVSAEEIILSGRGGLDLRLRFEDIRSFFITEKFIDVPDFLSIEAFEGHEKLQIVFHRENMDQLMRLLPLGDDPVSQSGLMLFQDHGTKDEFRAMILWLFEEYAEADEIDAALAASSLVLRVSLPRDVLDTNMKQLPGGQLMISVPIIDFFTLENPLSYYAVY